MAQYELPSRAEEIRRALAAEPGRFPLVEPTDHGLAPIEAVHDPGLPAFLATAWARVQAEQELAEVIPDTFVHPAIREGMGPPPTPDGATAGLGYWCFETMTPIVEGTYGAARERGGRRSHRRRPGPGRERCRVRALPPAWSPRPSGGLRRLLLLQQRGHRRPSPHGEHRRQGHDPRRRLPPRQRNPADLLRARRRPVRVPPRRSQPGLSVLRRVRGGDRRGAGPGGQPQPAPRARDGRRRPSWPL